MSLKDKVKTGLDETRLLILGAQVLFGFQLNVVFQEGFTRLNLTCRAFPEARCLSIRRASRFWNSLTTSEFGRSQGLSPG